MPRVRADNPTVFPNILMKVVSEMWQKSHEKDIYMSSGMEQKSAKSKKAMESQGNAKKKTRSEAAASTRPERVTL